MVIWQHPVNSLIKSLFTCVKLCLYSSVVEASSSTTLSSQWASKITKKSSEIHKIFNFQAAHCLDGFNRVTVIIGALNRIHGPMAWETDVTGSHNFISHPLYNSTSLSHDIALLRIPNARISLLDHANVGLVDLPLPTDVFVDLIGRNSTVSGYGVTSDGQNRQPSDVLRFITLKIISNVECVRTFGSFITAENLCVDTSHGRSPCVGRFTLFWGISLKFNEILIFFRWFW